MSKFSNILAIVLTFLCFTVPAIASPLIKSAPEIAQRVNSGEMVLLDIRSRGEWEDTGLAQGAWPVSMHEPDFKAKLEKVLSIYKPEQIALICATGGRTAYMQKTLDRFGIKGTIDVSEGMMGNQNGPGWLARKMPTISLEESQASFDAKFKVKTEHLWGGGLRP